MKWLTQESAKPTKKLLTGIRVTGTIHEAKVPASLQIKSILVPSDFSIQSRKALQYALSLAKEFRASVTLLHVIPAKCTALGRASDVALEDKLSRGGRRQLNALVRKLLGDEVRCHLLVRIGNPVAEIVRSAQALKCDLIVISTHGRTGLKQLFLGSVAATVLRQSPCPVLVLGHRPSEFRTSPTSIVGKKCSVIPKPCVVSCADRSDFTAEMKAPL